MEVRCSNCSTEYEFDDALVSARGTSVKCTNCGHQFRVHAAASKGAAAETWVVRDAQGRETTFTSLRDLQQGIVKGQLNPQHQMSHGGAPFRRLEDIYELQTFFNAARQRPPNRPAPRTLLGVGRDGQEASDRGSAPPPRRRAAEPPTQDRVTPVAGLPAVKVAPGDAAPASGQVGAARPASDSGSRPAHPRPSASGARQGGGQRAAAAVPWQNLQGLHGESEAADLAPGSGAAPRWIALVVVLGALALIAGTVGREYFLGFIRPQAAEPRLDERVPALLEQARLALGRGDFDNARAELAKASVLAEAEPQVVTASAQLELAQAEQSWLLLRAGAALEAARAAAAQAPASRKRLSEAEAVAAARATEQQVTEKKQLEQSFQDRMAKAKAAVSSAAMREPNTLDVVRARVDALRLEGQLKEARTLVSVLSAEASDPANAYSLGALDLAEGESGYASAIDRLRVAARAEEALGKARGLLVLVLCQTGDAPGASAELEKLETLAPRHRALTALRSLVEVAKSRAAPPPSEPAQVTRRPAPSPSLTVPAAGDDTQALLTHAASLHRQGDLSGAERVYQNVLSKSPSNIPALSGLGDIARQRRATATAAAFYDQVLKQDPNHVSTLMARADLYWHSGNRQAAVAMYRRALSQVGPSDALGQRALRRIEEFDKNGEGSGTEGASESEGSGAPPAKSPAPGEDEDEGEGTAPNPLDPEPIDVDEPEPTEGQGSPPSPSTPSKTAPKPAAPVPPPSQDTEGNDAPSDESTETP